MFSSHIISGSGTYNSQLKCTAKFSFTIAEIVEMKSGSIVTHQITFYWVKKEECFTIYPQLCETSSWIGTSFQVKN